MNNPGEYQFKKACDVSGLIVNGPNDRDPQVDNTGRFYQALEGNPLLALGEGYAAGHLDAKDLGGMVSALLQAEMRGDIQKLLTIPQKLRLWVHYMRGRLNLNKFRGGQSRIADDHYDLDNELMLSMFGEEKKYTSAFYYPEYGEFDLDLFQKLDLHIAGMRMGLKEGDRVCDWGFGFGTNTRYLVEKFGVHVTGITISKEQHAYAQH
ncbi:class I SAM-dependent methyltransferase, partial [Candidatus Gracilibacteria bacterium]|nr:class I SAM-dependent methyltransferase [Candidatus Gracilibacteria bacterium]